MQGPARWDNPDLAADIDSDEYRNLIARWRREATRAGEGTEYRRGLSIAYEEAADDLERLLDE